MRSAERITNTLATALHERGVSHAQAAKMTGRSQAWIQRRLSGTVTPNVADLEELAACAGMDVRVELLPRDVPA
jgi:transcriptional regulator with XRE-family HTH domain